MTVESGHPVVFWVRIKSADGALHRVAVNEAAQRCVSAGRVNAGEYRCVAVDGC